MQLSKPKLTVDFIKTFDKKIYNTSIDITDVDLKTFIIEENREDVKVIYEGFKDLVSNVKFDIVDGNLHIKVESREKTGISSATKLYSVFTMENKLSIYLPTHFKSYLVEGNNANVRINNLTIDNLNVEITHGSVKVKYCDVKENVKINSDNAFVSLKAIEANEVTLNTINGVSRLRNIRTHSNMSLTTDNGIINAKDINSNNTISAITNAGSVEFDDVYAKAVNIKTDTGIVNYFNGNFNRQFETNIESKHGVVRTNVNRDEIH
ncbi:MAG: DUF4097 family beta strand repeat-containing protein [Bacilli bacterium]